MYRFIFIPEMDFYDYSSTFSLRKRSSKFLFQIFYVQNAVF
ncbi:hypothetical protein LEP1GSC068_1530 [Leptospira sp. Fiocruz LV3954]|nr:hypothetical protein LEP1GSC068_1530 [Leptospira sp. Fiocruz LV3954]EMI61941.1 hypothetical protein LEP1GSC076_1972 [Leptospira sp. Fiocruz LV4135]